MVRWRMELKAIDSGSRYLVLPVGGTVRQVSA